uniref:Mitochondrial inner membrane protease subunit 2 n=1 Tax=Steinernema glaseri TaxID=37863 RepID=A0A1I7YPE8_9BILA
MAAASKPPSKFSRIFWRFMAGSAFITVPLTFVDTVGYPAVVVGSSMQPTLEGSDARWWKRDIIWMAAASKPPSKFSRIFWRFMAGSAFITVPLTFTDTVGYPAVVVGSSMQPTLEGSDARWWKRDIIWVNRLGINNHLVKNEVAVFVCPRDPKSVHVKRIVATEDKLVRPFIGPPSLIVPPGCCWMQSDNPTNHNDSNAYGPVPKGLFIGRVTRILWPPHRFGKLPPNPSDRLIRPPAPGFSAEED